jgi:hypothetical protein
VQLRYAVAPCLHIFCRHHQCAVTGLVHKTSIHEPRVEFLRMNTSLASFTHLRLHGRTYAVPDSMFPCHGEPLPEAANSTRSSNTVFVYEASRSRWQYPTHSPKSCKIIPAMVGHKCIYCFILNGVMSFPCLKGAHHLLFASTKSSYWRTNSSSVMHL